MKKRKELKAYAGRKDVLDLRCVGVKEAADIFGWSITKFRQEYRDGLHAEIRSHGKQFVLTDVLECAFPAYARRKDMVDLPCVGVKEAADIFGWSITKFRQKYRDVLHPEISTARTSHGKQFLLTDVIKCAFPEADNTAIHVVARNETRRLAISRKRKRKIKEEVNPDEVEDQPGEKLMRGLLVLLHESHKNGENIDFDELCSMYDILSPYLRSRIREPAKPKTSRRRSRLVHIPNQPENFFMAVRYFTEQNPEMQIKIYRRPEEETDQFRYSQVDSYTVNQVGSPGSIESGLREGYGAGDYILNFEDGLGLVYAQYTFAIG